MNKQLLFFDICGQSYGIDIMTVKEIITIPSLITNLPMSKPEVKGVLNLRGEVIPIIDLRDVLMEKQHSININKNRIIVTSITHDDLSQAVGYIVTDVDNVQTIDSKHIDTISNKRGITSLYKCGDDITILIDPIEILDGVV